MKRGTKNRNILPDLILKLPSSKWHFDFCMLIRFLIVTGFVSTVMQCIFIMIPGQYIVNFSSFSCPWNCAACLCKLNFFVKCWEQLAHVNCSAIKMFSCCQYLKYVYIQIITRPYLFYSDVFFSRTRLLKRSVDGFSRRLHMYSLTSELLFLLLVSFITAAAVCTISLHYTHTGYINVKNTQS